MNFDIKMIFEHVHMIVVATIFGTASFLYKVREGKASYSKLNIFSEVSFSLISAYVAYKLCTYFKTPDDLMWIFTGVAAWSGTRFLIKLEDLLERYVDKKLEIESEKKD